MNTITVIGRLTGDTELKQGQNGAIANFNLADNHGKDKDGKDEVTFFRCSAFGKTAERVANTYKKGLIVSVSGQLKIRQYVDNGGQNKTSNDLTVTAAGFAMISAPHDQDTQPPAQQQTQQRPAQQGYGQQPPQQNGYQQPPQQQGYGAPPAQQGYQQPSQGYNAPPVQQLQYQQPAAPQQQAPWAQQPQHPQQPQQQAPWTPQSNEPPF